MSKIKNELATYPLETPRNVSECLIKFAHEFNITVSQLTTLMLKCPLISYSILEKYLKIKSE